MPHHSPAGTLPWLQLADDALYWTARFYDERYGASNPRHARLPIMFTENGFCGTDWIGLDGRIQDTARIDFMHRYLRGLRRAVSEKIPVAGYFYWTLMDNFEWAEGYKPRFGLVHVDFATQQRTIKASGWWYREVIRNRGVNL